MRIGTFKKNGALVKKLALLAGLVASLCLVSYGVANADIEHSGSASYEDSNQDWNGDGELDGCDKNGDPYGDKLLTWHVSAGVHFGSFTVDKGYSLTIEPGAIVKFYLTTAYYAYGLEVHGTLIADGTPSEKIVFTSIRDDSNGGDTNNDGDATVPEPGNWGHIGFDSTSVDCILDNCIVQYGATCHGPSGEYHDWREIYIGDCSPTISNSVIRFSYYSGIECSNSNAIITGNTISNIPWNGVDCNNSSNPTISGNTITDCGYPVYLNHWSSKLDCFPTISGNTFSNNSCNGVGINSGTLEKSATLRAINNPYVLQDMTVDSGVTLTIEPGAIIKFNIHTMYSANGIWVHGTLIADGTPSEKIVFTSIRDDSYGGDTNNDGDTTSAAPTDWGSIYFYNNSADCILDNTIIQYAGTEYWGSYYAHFAIAIGDCNPTISNSLIQYGAYDGIYCSNSSATISGNTISNLAWSGISCNDSSTPTISENTITENANGIYSSSSSNPLINNNNIYNNTTYGVYNADASLTINAENNWWGDASGPYDPSEGPPDHNPDGKGDKVSDYVSYRPWSTQSVVGVEEDTTTTIVVPEVFSLLQNYPNPVASGTHIEYALPKATELTLKVYDATGRVIRTLAVGNQEPGIYRIYWNGTDNSGKKVASGIYFYRLETGNFMATRKLTILR